MTRKKPSLDKSIKALERGRDGLREAKEAAQFAAETAADSLRLLGDSMSEFAEIDIKGWDELKEEYLKAERAPSWIEETLAREYALDRWRLKEPTTIEIGGTKYESTDGATWFKAARRTGKSAIAEDIMASKNVQTIIDTLKWAKKTLPRELASRFEAEVRAADFRTVKTLAHEHLRYALEAIGDWKPRTSLQGYNSLWHEEMAKAWSPTHHEALRVATLGSGVSFVDALKGRLGDDPKHKARAEKLAEELTAPIEDIEAEEATIKPRSEHSSEADLEAALGHAELTSDPDYGRW